MRQRRNNGRAAVLAACALALALASGCAELRAAADRVVNDPVDSALLVVHDQWQQARGVFYAQDAAAIAGCMNAGGDENACAALRCSSPACMTFREKVDPKVTLAYNVALQARSIDSIDEVIDAALVGFAVLEKADPTRAAVYKALADALRAERERLGVSAGTTAATGGAS